MSERHLSPEVEQELRLIWRGQSDEDLDRRLNGIVERGRGVVAQLACALESGEPELALAAARVVEELPYGWSGALVAPLLERLHDDAFRVRFHAACALLAAANSVEEAAPAVPVLTEALGHEDEWVRWFAARRAGYLPVELGEPLVPTLAECMGGDDRPALAAASAAARLAPEHRERACAVLAAAAAAGDLEALEHLAEVPEGATDQVLEVLTQNLGDPQRERRSLAAYALGRLGRWDDRVVGALPALEAALSDGDAEVRQQVLNALVELGAPAVPVLRAGATRGDPAALDALREALLELGDEAAANEARLLATGEGQLAAVGRAVLDDIHSRAALQQDINLGTPLEVTLLAVCLVVLGLLLLARH